MDELRQYHNEIYRLFAVVLPGESAILKMSLDDVYLHFGGMPEIQEFVGRASSRYYKQGSIMERGEDVVITIQDDANRPPVSVPGKDSPLLS